MKKVLTGVRRIILTAILSLGVFGTTVFADEEVKDLMEHQTLAPYVGRTPVTKEILDTLNSQGLHTERRNESLSFQHRLNTAIDAQASQEEIDAILIEWEFADANARQKAGTLGVKMTSDPGLAAAQARLAELDRQRKRGIEEEELVLKRRKDAREERRNTREEERLGIARRAEQRAEEQFEQQSAEKLIALRAVNDVAATEYYTDDVLRGKVGRIPGQEKSARITPENREIMSEGLHDTLMYVSEKIDQQLSDLDLHSGAQVESMRARLTAKRQFLRDAITGVRSMEGTLNDPTLAPWVLRAGNWDSVGEARYAAMDMGTQAPSATSGRKNINNIIDIARKLKDEDRKLVLGAQVDSANVSINEKTGNASVSNMVHFPSDLQYWQGGIGVQYVWNHLMHEMGIEWGPLRARQGRIPVAYQDMMDDAYMQEVEDRLNTGLAADERIRLFRIMLPPGEFVTVWGDRFNFEVRVVAQSGPKMAEIKAGLSDPRRRDGLVQMMAETGQLPLYTELWTPPEIFNYLWEEVKKEPGYILPVIEEVAEARGMEPKDLMMLIQREDWYYDEGGWTAKDQKVEDLIHRIKIDLVESYLGVPYDPTSLDKFMRETNAGILKKMHQPGRISPAFKESLTRSGSQAVSAAIERKSALLEQATQLLGQE